MALLPHPYAGSRAAAVRRRVLGSRLPVRRGKLPLLTAMSGFGGPEPGLSALADPFGGGNRT